MSEIVQISCSLLIGASYLIVFPWLVIALISKYPQIFKGVRRQMLFLALWGVVSWLFTNALWYLPMLLDLRQPAGAEAGMSICGGWAYMGFAGIPFFLIYGLICFFRRK